MIKIRTTWMLFSLVACTLVNVGCFQSKEQAETTDEVRLLAGEIKHLSSNPETFKDAFTSDAVVPDAAAFSNYMFGVDDATVRGNEATVKVEIIEEGLNETSKGIFEWKLRKEGDTWKFLDVQLP